MHNRPPEDRVEAALDALVPLLRQFVAAGREEHMTHAAELLGIPQPTLSRSIARLEAELGVPLFTRPGRSVKLTRHGRYLLESSERVLLTLATSLELLTGEADPARGRVALGFLHTFGEEIVPRLIRDFRASHPAVRFALVQDGSQRLLARLRDGELDLCLTSPLSSAPDVLAQALAEQRIDLFVPAGHRLARQRHGMPLAEAAAEDFIVMEPGYGLRTITDAMCRTAGFDPRVTFEGQEVDTARGLVGAGLGVSLLPATTSSLADPSVAPVRITEPRAARTVGIAWSADRPLTAPAVVFRDFALTYAGRLPETEAG
jgi:DNA-binding transcriptional LysR family regulator